MSPWLSDLFLSSQSDERLAALAGAGHDRAFTVIVERYRGELHAHARQLNSEGRADDIVQQTFLNAFAALRSGAEVRHLRGWLHQIVRNAAVRIHAPADAPLDELSIAGSPLDDVVQERALALNALSEVGRLPARQRQALLGTVQGRHRAEIASSMGLSEGAVRQLVHRARMTVRAAVTAVTPYPLLRWLAARSGSSAEIAIGAGAASASGATLKLGALLASGVIAGGIAIDVDRHPPSHNGSAGAAVVQAHARGGSRPAAAVGPSAARRAVGAFGGGLHGTLPAVLGRGGAAGTRGHEVEHGGGGADSRVEGHSGQGPDTSGGPGPSHGSVGDGTKPESSSGPGPGSTGFARSTGSSDGSGGGSGDASHSGDSSHSGDGGSTSGGSGDSSTSQTSDGGSSGPATTATTASSSSGPGDGGGTSTTSGGPGPTTTSSSSGSSDGLGGGSETGGHGSDSGGQDSAAGTTSVRG